jgi:hypothetical protein
MTRRRRAGAAIAEIGRVTAVFENAGVMTFSKRIFWHGFAPE